MDRRRPHFFLPDPERRQGLEIVQGLPVNEFSRAKNPRDGKRVEGREITRG